MYSRLLMSNLKNLEQVLAAIIVSHDLKLLPADSDIYILKNGSIFEEEQNPDIYQQEKPGTGKR